MRFVKPVGYVLLSLAAAAATAGCGGESGITDPEIPAPPPTPNYVSLQSDAGDFIGGGNSYNYTQANAIIEVTSLRNHLRVKITGDQEWFANIEPPSTSERIEPGNYTGVRRWGTHDPALGGLSWIGEARSCNSVSGWLTVDSVTYEGSKLTAIDLSFEQHCESATAALRGTIHWRSDDTTVPPGPVNPVPPGLWRPASGSTPAAGNYVYLNSDAGDYIGGGRTSTYTPESAVIAVTAAATANGARLTISVNGAAGWTGEFQTMRRLSRLEPGYYADLHRYPFHNPTKGGLSWRGEGRGCNGLLGWFAIDLVTYTNGNLTAVDLRFEQHCESATPALHGVIHWRG